MDRFIFKGQPARVVFGQGSIQQLGEEVARLKAKRVMICTTPPQAEAVEALKPLLGETFKCAFTDAVMHSPVEVTAQAMAMVQQQQVDGLVSFGGGSTIGLAKAIALRTGLPHVAIPTTYAGSEMTDILGQTEDGIKTTTRDPLLRPPTVIYDVDTTLSLPVDLTLTSGVNAIAHAIEALYAQDRDPITVLMAKEGIAALAKGLPLCMQDPHTIEGRTQAQYGAWLCGAALGVASMALHHKLCHVVGGSFDMPHAETHTILLPHTAQFNAGTATQEMAVVAEILGAQSVGLGIYDLIAHNGGPIALKDIGFKEADMAKAVEIATLNPYWNPRPFTSDDITQLLTAAFHGHRPT